jgi:hypothetical protein
MAAIFRFFSLTYQVANGRLLQVLLTHLPGSKWMDGKTIDLDLLITMTQTQRDGEYKQRSRLRGFCHYPHRGVDTGRRNCETTEYKSTDSLSPPSFKCNVLRESLSVDSQNIPCATLKRRESWVISVCMYLCPDHRERIKESTVYCHQHSSLSGMIWLCFSSAEGGGIASLHYQVRILHVTVSAWMRKGGEYRL